MEGKRSTALQQRPTFQLNPTIMSTKPSPATSLLPRHDPRHPLIPPQRLHRPQSQTTRSLLNSQHLRTEMHPSSRRHHDFNRQSRTAKSLHSVILVHPLRMLLRNPGCLHPHHPTAPPIHSPKSISWESRRHKQDVLSLFASGNMSTASC